MEQQQQFDLSAGRKREEIGKSLASTSRPRGIARAIAKKSPEKSCTIDQVQEILIQNRIDLGNAAGSIFDGGEWEFTGKWIPSSRTTNNARSIRVWKLREERKEMGDTWEQREIAEHCGL